MLEAVASLKVPNPIATCVLNVFRKTFLYQTLIIAVWKIINLLVGRILY
jgi:hypothetical protein